MAATTAASPAGQTGEPENFSLVLGGPLFQLLRRSRLTDDGLQLLRLRILVISLLCWLPLLVLCALEGQLLVGTVAVPFLRDMEVHARFLVALPSLLVAELIVHQRIQPVVSQFLTRQLVPEDALGRFEAALASAKRWRNSLWGELALVILTLVVGSIIFKRYLVLDAQTWYATPSPAGPRFSLAGTWYQHVSLPIFQFLSCRWYFRLFIWARLLWQVSRIPLRVIPAHPDRVGGLSFLSAVVTAFAPIAVGHGALLAGWIANQIFYFNASLPQFKIEILVTVVFLGSLVFLPLLVFAPQLAEAKRKARREYDALAQRYVREFDSKWLRGGAPADEALVGSADIQSLADLGNSLEVIRSMRTAPITKDSLVFLVLSVLLPIAPLLLTMMPLEELLNKLFGVLF
jgi:hypothetical protein